MTNDSNIMHSELKGSAMLRRLRNFGWLSAEDLCRVGIGFFITILLAQHLGPAAFGVLGYLAGFTALLLPLAVFGLDAIVMRQLVSNPDDTAKILGSSLAIRLAGSLLAAVLMLILFSMFNGPPLATFSMAAIASIVIIAAPWQSFNLHFKATERPALFAVPRIFVVVTVAIATAYYVWLGGKLEGFVWIKSAEAVVLGLAAILAYFWARRKRPKLRIARSEVQSLAKQGLPLFLSALAIVFYMRIDQLMLGNMVPSEELGRYTLAVRLSESAFFIPIALQTAFYPALVKASKNPDKNVLRNDMRNFLDTVAISCLSLAVMVGIGSHFVITTFMSADYSASITTAWILAFALPFVGIGVARSAFLTIEGHLWAAPLTTVIGATANIALNFALIPRFGANGAAVASVAAYWLAAHGACFILPVLRPVGRDIGRSLNPLGLIPRVLGKLGKMRREGSV